MAKKKTSKTPKRKPKPPRRQTITQLKYITSLIPEEIGEKKMIKKKTKPLAKPKTPRRPKKEIRKDFKGKD